MIRFSYPLVLLAIPFVAAAAFFLLRHRGIPALRLATLILLTVALADPRRPTQEEQENLLILVDRSASTVLSVSDEEVTSRIRGVIDRLPDWSIGVAQFALDARMISPLSSDPPSLRFRETDGTRTVLSPAITLALSTLPNDGANQIVLISDGRFEDPIDEAIGEAQRRHIPISVLSIGAKLSSDVSIVRFDAPGEVSVGRRFEMKIEVRTSSPQPAVLAVYRDDELVSQTDLELGSRGATFTLYDTLREAASHRYEAVIRGSEDTIPENDRLSILIQSTEQPPLLLVDGGVETAIPDLLSSLEIGYDHLAALPGLETLGLYRQTVLTGLEFNQLAPDEVAALDKYVRGLGGGLLVVEGERETRDLSGGGIETLLPISYTVPEKGQEASLAIVFVLDRSSSMQARAGGMLKIDILKEATAASVALLSPDTLVGILAFNREREWPVSIAPIGDAETVYNALRPLTALGGTDIYYAVVDALDGIGSVQARSKHILLVSDGITTDERRDFNGLIARLRSLEDITLSAIAVGTTPNTQLLGALVSAGGGTLYRADDFAELPQVSIQATQRISRQRYVTGPIEVAGSLATQASIEALPLLGGYVASYPRTTSHVGLWAGDDPVYASWRIGLGIVGVLNTDLAGEWTAEWVSWSGFSPLFREMLASTEPLSHASAGFSVSVEESSDGYVLWLDAQTPEGGFADHLDLAADLLPDGATFALDQVGPGMYRGSFPTPSEGGHTLRIHTADESRFVTLPFNVPYSAEYAAFGPDLSALEEIADRTGGVVLDDERPLPDAAGRASAGSVSLVSPLIFAALALFLLDLVARKWPRRRSNRNEV